MKTEEKEEKTKENIMQSRKKRCIPECIRQFQYLADITLQMKAQLHKLFEAYLITFVLPVSIKNIGDFNIFG